MKRDLDHPIVNLDGVQLREVDPETKGVTPLTVKHYVTGALINAVEDDKKSVANESVARWKLALRLHAGGEQDVSTEDLALIKRLVGTTPAPMIVGQIFEWCEKDLPPEPQEKGK